jgi:uncharacterized membrane protein YeaQ/YmgE (transglycosylase-associated protein family)
VIVLLLVVAVLGFVLCLPARAVAKREERWFPWDFAGPVGAVVLWILLTSFGIGHQSLSHLIEIPIALLFAVLALYLRVFIVDRFTRNPMVNSLAVVALAFTFVVALRLFMPFLPE